MNQGQLAGVVVGFLLSQLATAVAWLITQRRERKLVRLLLSLEIEQNLALLKGYWDNVSLPPDEPFADEDEDEDDERDYVQTPPPPPKPESEVVRLTARATGIPLPPFAVKAFESQLGVLPKALTASEIKDVWRVYEELGQIRTAHSWLLELKEAGEEKLPFPSASAAVRAQGLLSATFTEKRYGALFDLKGHVLNVLRRGNPLTQEGDPGHHLAPGGTT